ncbi:hypothetical protein GOB94_02005 [Granulicella sp. 5B5]|uniref:DNA adenine methylase n=1 Tax=Granulicella sp. 5B5 TaxID=1617967 RepID=UPI0015F38051|nr:hypothetical protein GOB94_02005 [Granulicella sp. 5B5]
MVPAKSTFLDAFSGSTVVSRYAKQLGFAVTANDWEPYAEALAQCFLELRQRPFRNVFLLASALPSIQKSV